MQAREQALQHWQSVEHVCRGIGMSVRNEQHWASSPRPPQATLSMGEQGLYIRDAEALEAGLVTTLAWQHVV